MRELLNFQIRIDPLTAHHSYGAWREGVHDDLVLAVALAWAHLGSVRHRSEVVEYRVEQHLEALKDRLRALAFVSRNVTRDEAGEGKQIPASMDCKRGKMFRSGPGAGCPFTGA